MDLPHTITIERPTYTKDRTGGPVPTWAVLQRNVRCYAQPRRAFEITQFAKQNQFVLWTFYLQTDVAVTISDRILFGTKTIGITGYRDMAGRGRWYAIDGEERDAGQAVQA